MTYDADEIIDEPQEVDIDNNAAADDLEKQKDLSKELIKDESNHSTGSVRKKKKFFQLQRPELTQEQKKFRCYVCSGFAFVVLLTGVILLFKSLSKLDDTEYGLSYAKHSKILEEAAQSGGLHAGPPGFEFIKFPSTYISEISKGTCVSVDGLRVDFDVTYQYILRQEYLYEVVIRYRSFTKWAEIVEAAGLSAIHHSCAEYDIASFQHKRALIQATMEENLRLKLGGNFSDDNDRGVFAEAISLQLSSVDLPDEYEESVEQKQSAEEEISLARNQRKQTLTTANTELLAAKQESLRLLEAAQNDADVVLTEASLKADETAFMFEKEAFTLAAVKETLNLTTDGVLTYAVNRLLASVDHLKVTANEPAQLSRKENLIQ